MSVAKQGGKHQFPDLARVCCWDGDRSRTKLIFSWFVCLKNEIFVSDCFEDMRLEKNWWQWGERISHNLIAFTSPIRLNKIKTASSLLKRRGNGKTYVTLIQEMNSQWEVLLPINWWSDLTPSFSLPHFLSNPSNVPFRIKAQKPVYTVHYTHNSRTVLVPSIKLILYKNLMCEMLDNRLELQ